MIASRMLFSACFCLLCASTDGCGDESLTTVPANQINDVGPEYIAPEGTGPRTIDGVEYGYIATPDREAEILAGFKKLAVGQTREEVRAVIGLPDTALPMYAKENEDFHGWSYRYKIKMHRGGANRKDLLILVYFDPDGKLDWAVADNIPELHEVGGHAGE